MVEDKEQQEEVKDRQELLESLADASRRMNEENAAKKRDTKIHGENVKAIQEEIDEYLIQLKQVGDD